MLALGVSLEDAAAGPLARSGSFSGGRDIGVVFNLPGHAGPTVLPACGGVGAQYTPAAGWARSEEHTSELQSQSNLVCRLLLEKKKKINEDNLVIEFHNILHVDDI